MVGAAGSDLTTFALILVLFTWQQVSDFIAVAAMSFLTASTLVLFT